MHWSGWSIGWREMRNCQNTSGNLKTRCLSARRTAMRHLDGTNSKRIVRFTMFNWSAILTPIGSWATTFWRPCPTPARWKVPSGVVMS